MLYTAGCGNQRAEALIIGLCARRYTVSHIDWVDQGLVMATEPWWKLQIIVKDLFHFTSPAESISHTNQKLSKERKKKSILLKCGELNILQMRWAPLASFLFSFFSILILVMKTDGPSNF